MFMKISAWPVLGMLLAVAAASYLLGCFNGAVIVSKYILRDDVRNHGSGNAGLTNFHRTFGGPLTAVVILCDVLKAVIAVLLGSWLLGFIDPLFGKYWAGVFCLLGHMFPCMFHFSYQRYLENCIRNTFGREGTPIVLSIRQKGDKED